MSDRLGQSHQQLGDLVAGISDVTGTLAHNDQATTNGLSYVDINVVANDFDPLSEPLTVTVSVALEVSPALPVSV